MRSQFTEPGRGLFDQQARQPAELPRWGSYIAAFPPLRDRSGDLARGSATGIFALNCVIADRTMLPLLGEGTAHVRNDIASSADVAQQAPIFATPLIVALLGYPEAATDVAYRFTWHNPNLGFMHRPLSTCLSVPSPILLLCDRK
jgi:hypothetical protein